MASQCYQAGQPEAAVRYSDEGQAIVGLDTDEVPYGLYVWLGAAYQFVGHPERSVQWCRTRLARDPDAHTLARTALVIALSVTGCRDEATASANGLIEAAEATHNPWALSFALLACGLAYRGLHAERALDALHRGLMIAQESGNRGNESHLLGILGRLEAEHGETLAALDHLTTSIGNYHDSGMLSNMRGPLASLVALLDRLGRHIPAATVAGFAFSPLTAWALPELNTAITHLRDVLGDQTYESLAHKGEAMTTAAMVTYAYDQIDQARTGLDHRN